MLARGKRLPVRAKIIKSIEFSTPFFTVKIGKNNEGKSRFAFIVSKKVDQRATRRNKVKRQLRNIIEEEYNRIKPGYDLLFKIKGEALEVKKEDLSKALIEILKKEKLIK